MKSNFLQLSRKLTELRNERALNVNEYLEAKSEKLKAFFNTSGYRCHCYRSFGRR